MRILLVFILLLFPSLAMGEVVLRFGEHEGYTRIVLETKVEPIYRIFSLSAPSRLVLDLRGLDFSKRRSVNRGLVERYRAGRFESGINRIVFDVGDNFSVRKFFIIRGDENFRLVVDIESSGSVLNFSRLSDGWRSDEGLRAPILSEDSISGDISLPLIAIDAGHGGVDGGAIGRFGTAEKGLTLRAARVMKSIFEDSGRYRVLLIRDGDIFIPLSRRYEIAEGRGASLLISVHTDSVMDRSVRGASVYTLSREASDEQSARLAEVENSSDVLAGGEGRDYDAELVEVLVDLRQRGTVRESATIAGHVVSSLRGFGGLRLLRNPHRFAGFAVLKSSSIPSILVEMGFISNIAEEELLKRGEFHESFARVLLKSLDDYFAR